MKSIGHSEPGGTSDAGTMKMNKILSKCLWTLYCGGINRPLKWALLKVYSGEGKIRRP